MKRCCFNCDFSEWLDGPEFHLDSKMHCRFHAPQRVHGIGTGCTESMWPVMTMKDWCGDFIKRTDRPKGKGE